MKGGRLGDRKGGRVPWLAAGSLHISFSPTTRPLTHPHPRSSPVHPAIPFHFCTHSPVAEVVSTTATPLIPIGLIDFSDDATMLSSSPTAPSLLGRATSASRVSSESTAPRGAELIQMRRAVCQKKTAVGVSPLGGGGVGAFAASPDWPRPTSRLVPVVDAST